MLLHFNTNCQVQVCGKSFSQIKQILIITHIAHFHSANCCLDLILFLSKGGLLIYRLISLTGMKSTCYYIYIQKTFPLIMLMNRRSPVIGRHSYREKHLSNSFSLDYGENDTCCTLENEKNMIQIRNFNMHLLIKSTRKKSI